MDRGVLVWYSFNKFTVALESSKEHRMLGWLKKLLHGSNKPADESRPRITIVSGLPRSGTSLMMQMLEAGGLPPLTDGERESDTDNPKGYYEFERVKKLKDGDTAWLPQAEGKAVKVISALLSHLPDSYSYRVVFMRRKMEEILASQEKMLTRRAEDKKVEDDEMADLYRKHLRETFDWIENQPNFEYLDISFNELVQDPLPAVREVVSFLDWLDLDADAMARVVDPELYRNRS